MSFNIRATHIQISIVSRCLVVHCECGIPGPGAPALGSWHDILLLLGCPLARARRLSVQFLEDRPRSAYRA